MRKKLTITIDEDVYDGLYRIAGKRRISRFIESLVRPYVISGDIREGYRQMAADTEREAEAMEWVETGAHAVTPVDAGVQGRPDGFCHRPDDREDVLSISPGG